MDQEELNQRLFAAFAGELRDNVRILERDLLAIEANPDPANTAALITTLFRSAHSLKGAARAVNLEAIEAACHRMEGIFADVRDGRERLSTARIQTLLKMIDALKDAENRVRDKRSFSDSPLLQLVQALIQNDGDTSAPLTRPAATPAPAASAPNPAPAPTPAPAHTTPSPPPPSAEIQTEPGRHASDNMLRVSSDKLDKLIARSGDLLVASRRMQLRLDSLEALQDFARILRPRAQHRTPGTRRTHENFKKFEKDLQTIVTAKTNDRKILDEIVTALDTELRDMRMMPFGEACDGLERVVRDVAHATGKNVALKIRGRGIELDRAILDGLQDPLRHLVRNAIDHGIEAPLDRSARKKPALATITVRAELRGAMVEVSVHDDGRGLDFTAIRARATTQKLVTGDDERELSRAIFLSGFSTTTEVTEISGRGVGLDVVKTKIEEMRGSIKVESIAGQETKFILTLPLTLTTIRGVIVRAGGHTFAVDASAVEQLLRIETTELRVADGKYVLPLKTGLIEVASLAATLGMGTPDSIPPAKMPAVVLAYGQRRVAFMVDELIAEQEIVIQGLGPRLTRVRNISGATILADGTLVPILNAFDLLDGVLTGEAAKSVPLGDAPVRRTQKRLVVADDSVTTRILEKNILEAAGYEVIVAVDGAEAWRLIQEVNPDLVVSDVEMPNMDGFSLTQTIRGSKQYRNLPVILVTGLSNDRDRARGLEVGADAYIVKSTFDQRVLLETIEQVI
jgi:two-component system chemotaxis sensor kinase CheA